MLIQRSPAIYESCPVIVLDTTQLNFDLFQVERNYELIQDTIAQLPQESFSLVIFASCINTKDIAFNPLNILKLLSLVPEDVLDCLKNVFVVHGSALINSFFKLSSLLKLNKYHFEVFNCERLDELGAFLPLVDLPISLRVLRCEPGKYQATVDVRLNSALVDWNEYAVVRFMSIYNNLSLFILKQPASVGRRDWISMISLNVEEESSLNCNILTALINENAPFDLTQWSFLEHFFILVKYFQQLNDMRKPLVPIKILAAPKKYETGNQLMERILLFNHYHHKNAYITIKVFQLLKRLFLNLRGHLHQNNEHRDSKDLERYIGRQETRFVISLTKIFYNELEEEGDEDLEFELMFHFWNQFMKNFDFGKFSIAGSLLNLEAKIDLNEWQNFERLINQKVPASYYAASQSPRLEGNRVFFDKPKLRSTFSSSEKAMENKRSTDLNFKVEIKGSEKVKQLTRLYEEMLL